MKPASSTNRVAPMACRSRGAEGVALVITLILLAVIAFMAIAFLVLSSAERGSVSTTTDQTTARLAADAAVERLENEFLMPMMVEKNPFALELMVSTNYINPRGFLISGGADAVQNPTNVNFDYKVDGSALTRAESQENLNNLLFSPPVPVYTVDRDGQTHFQHYLDINRNGRYEPTGWLVVTNELNDPVYDANNVVITNLFVGDPNWIGGLEFPERPHSPTNRFIWRHAYFVAPIGKTLDVNFMHNAGRFQPMNQNGFVRNQGVGTWELNMAAFLTDLNTNMWYWATPDPIGLPRYGSGYTYDVTDPINLLGINRGAGFDDATSLLRYRYTTVYEDGKSAPSWDNLWRPTQLFQRAAIAFGNDLFDTYGSGPLATNSTPFAMDPDDTRGRPESYSWPGAYNRNLFSAPTDLLDRSKTKINVTGTSLTDRLEEAGRRNGSYDRYTFHRLLSQLGTESAPESDRINVNYQNFVNGKAVPNYETNFVDWTPLDFFTNAANKLLSNAGFEPKVLNIRRIQIYPDNLYTPSVHRALQLAANIFEATTNKAMPTVFRPHFRREVINGTNYVFIVGYSEVITTADIAYPYYDVLDRSLPSIGANDMVYGVPLVIGARKGYPNFNEFAMDTQLTVTRKLQFLRDDFGKIFRTNQMYTLAVSNTFGIEFWNSYGKIYSNVTVRATVEAFPVITNNAGNVIFSRVISNSTPATTGFPVDAWPAFTRLDVNGHDGSMVVPLTSTAVILQPQATFSHAAQELVPLTGNFEQHGTFPVPQWKLNLRTRVVASIIKVIDGRPRIIDFVNLAQSEKTLDITEVLTRDSPDEAVPRNKPYQPSGTLGSPWLTNHWGGILDARTFGILNQIKISQFEVESESWNARSNATSVDFFRAQFSLGAKLTTGTTFSLTNTFYAPFSPTRNISVFTSWQANDPLVHYTIGDLEYTGGSNRWGFDMSFSSVTNIGGINDHYEPWGGGLSHSGSASLSELAIKDPLVKRSDNWDFPTNKLANIGWLGRVHRGTPWQTVYLKSKLAEPGMWATYAGGGINITNYGQIRPSLVATNFVIDETVMSRPTNDWAIPDIFTAALYDNATRGQLSINQTEIAAWSAVLSGVPVLSNLNAWSVIQPAAADPALQYIVDGIVKKRNSRPDHAFKRLAEICSVPELTDRSPYIDTTGPVNDAVYERIPQQVLGLLRCDKTPRFVVYAFGQSLKPAPRSVLTSGPYIGLCTNYQVTAEVATRSVIRIDGAPDDPQVIVENFNVLPPD